MTFKVSKIAAAPSYDSLPVAKIITYPLEKRDYRPFAQNILCVGPEVLHLRMWAFEVSPTETSRLLSVLYLFRDRPEMALMASLGPADIYGRPYLQVSCLKDGALYGQPLHAPERGVQLHPHNGEDLQGVYWGGTLDIPLALLQEWGGALSLAVGDSFLGNFFKTCEDVPFVHRGCFFPADCGGSMLHRSDMGTFEVVAY